MQTVLHSLRELLNLMKMRTFYKKLPLLIKNYIDPTYKKLKPQISPFIKNSIFGNNRDPCQISQEFFFITFARHLQLFAKSVRLKQEMAKKNCPFSLQLMPNMMK